MNNRSSSNFISKQNLLEMILEESPSDCRLVKAAPVERSRGKIQIVMAAFGSLILWSLLRTAGSANEKETDGCKDNTTSNCEALKYITKKHKKQLLKKIAM